VLSVVLLLHSGARQDFGRILILQTPFHRRDAEAAEGAQSPWIRSPRRLCVLGVSAVNPDLNSIKLRDSVGHLSKPLCDALVVAIAQNREPHPLHSTRLLLPPDLSIID
jgi:hypothetical protein